MHGYTERPRQQRLAAAQAGPPLRPGRAPTTLISPISNSIKLWFRAQKQENEEPARAAQGKGLAQPVAWLTTMITVSSGPCGRPPQPQAHCACVITAKGNLSTHMPCRYATCHWSEVLRYNVQESKGRGMGVNHPVLREQKKVHCSPQWDEGSSVAIAPQDLSPSRRISPPPAGLSLSRPMPPRQDRGQ